MVCLIASSFPPPHWEMENPITNKEHGKVLSLHWKDLIIGVNSTNICAVDVGISERRLFFLAPRLLGASCAVFGWEDDSELGGSVCCEACVYQAPKNEGAHGWWLWHVQPVHGPRFNLMSRFIGTSTEFQAINQVSIFQEKDCQCTQRLFSVPMALNDPPLLLQFALEWGPPGSRQQELSVIFRRHLVCSTVPSHPALILSAPGAHHIPQCLSNANHLGKGEMSFLAKPQSSLHSS